MTAAGPAAPIEPPPGPHRSEPPGIDRLVGTSRVVGILGGTFDPVHYGHLGLAEDVRKALVLDQVRLIPAGEPPHRERPVALASQRLAMVVLACKDAPGLVADDREVRRVGVSYTIDTLRELRSEMPDRPLALIVGSDAFAGLERWHRWRELFSCAHFIVAERPGAPLVVADLTPGIAEDWRRRFTDPSRLADATAGAIVRTAITPRPISATAIRQALAGGTAGLARVRGLLPPPVLDYIGRNQLYRTPDGS